MPVSHGDEATRPLLALTTAGVSCFAAILVAFAAGASTSRSSARVARQWYWGPTPGLPPIHPGRRFAYVFADVTCSVGSAACFCIAWCVWAVRVAAFMAKTVLFFIRDELGSASHRAIKAWRVCGARGMSTAFI